MAFRRVKKLKECAFDAIFFDLYGKIKKLFSPRRDVTLTNEEEEDFKLSRDQVIEQMRAGGNTLADIARLEFARENLTPIVSSLKEIKHYHNSNSPENCSSWDSCVVLILRHFRLLEILKHDCFKRKSSNAVAKAVQFFHQEQQVTSNRNGEDVDALTTFAQSSSARLGTIRWTFDSSFTGI